MGWFALEALVTLLTSALCIAVHKLAVEVVSKRESERGMGAKTQGLMRALIFLLVAHLVEIALFAAALFGLDKAIPDAELTGDFAGKLEEYLYFSATTYSSLGIGDIIPKGHLRFLVGVEALVGLIMIAWTAAFLFSETDQQSRS